MTKPAYVIGLDYGTNSVRCLIADAADGTELASYVCEYTSGEHGVLLDHSDDKLARQNPADYHDSTTSVVKGVLQAASEFDKSFDASGVIGIGVDTTCSTAIPVTKDITPLCMLDEFKDNLNAYAWLWKDHTGYAEADEITELARTEHPEYLARCGSIYPSEFFFSKILHCLRADPRVFDAAYTWIEECDYIPAMLGGLTRPEDVKHSRCGAGHKAMFANEWGDCRQRISLRNSIRSWATFANGFIVKLSHVLLQQPDFRRSGRKSLNFARIFRSLLVVSMHTWGLLGQASHPVKWSR